MRYKLSTSIQVGHQIKTANGWRKVIAVTETSVKTKDGEVKFGDFIDGWKLK
jgi:hypothetical protein